MTKEIISQMLDDIAELQHAQEALQDVVDNLDYCNEMMDNICFAKEALEQVGACGELLAVLDRDGGMESLGIENWKRLDSEALKAAMEGALTDKIGQALKTFGEWVVDMVKRIGEFFAKLFKTTSYKISELLENATDKLDWDKKSSLLTKENYLKVGQCTKEICEVCKEIKLPSFDDPTVRMFGNGEAVAMQFAAAYKDVLHYDPSKRRFVVDGKAAQFSEMTLQDTGFVIRDIIMICAAFRDKEKSYTAVQTIFVKMNRGYWEGLLTQNAPLQGWTSQQINSIKACIGIDIAKYLLFSKLQSITAKLISGFYHCLGDSSVTINKEQANVPLLQHTQA